MYLKQYNIASYLARRHKMSVKSHVQHGPGDFGLENFFFLVGKGGETIKNIQVSFWF